MLPWYPALRLMIDAMRVIDMRLKLIAAGKGTSEEMYLMVNEKVEALFEAGNIFIRVGNSSHVIDNYCRIVAANVARLSA